QGLIPSPPGLDFDQLGAVDIIEEDTTLGEIEFATRPTLRFHGSIPALIEQLRNLIAQEQRILLAAPNQAEVERMATVLREYQIAYRLGSRNPHAGSENLYDESSHLPGNLRVPVIVRAQLANGVSVPEQSFILF